MPAAALHPEQAYIAITVAALGLVATWLAFLVWGWRTGQFKDFERGKYRVFEDELPPARDTEGKA